MQKWIKGITAVLLVATMLLIVLYQFCPSSLILSLVISTGTTCYHFAMRLSVGLLFSLFMRNRADYRKPWYQLRSWEPTLYQRLHVKDWKGRMPTYEPDLFNPRKHNWYEIAQAMCQSELVHETIVALSFLPLLTSIWFGNIGVFIITSVIATAIDMLFVILQRYNRPRIIAIAERRKRN